MVTLFAVVGFASANLVTAAEEVVEAGRVIVVKPNATVQLFEGEPKPVTQARVLTYSRRNGQWLWVDELWGWIDQDEVLSLEDAEKAFTEAIEKAAAADKVDPRALHSRGVVRLELGKQKEALADFDAVLDANVKVPGVLLNRGLALLELGEFDDAVDAMTAAIAADPADGRPYDARSRALLQREFFDAALSDSEKAVELSPREPVHWHNLGQIQIARGKFEAAVRSFNEAITLSPRFVEALGSRGYCLKKLGRLTAAADDYRRAIKIDPRLATPHNDLAWLLATTPDESVRDAEEAVKEAEEAVRIAEAEEEAGRPNPLLGQYVDTLAAAYAAAEQWEAAEKAGRRAVELLEGADEYAADQRLTRYLQKKPYVEPKP